MYYVLTQQLTNPQMGSIQVKRSVMKSHVAAAGDPVVINNSI